MRSPTTSCSRRCSSAKSDRVFAAPPLPPRQLAWVTGQAALVVSNRYHPIVFGLHRGVPAVGICVDDYTEQKIRGVMEQLGVPSWAVSASAPEEVLAQAIAECWARREELAATLAGRAGRQAELKTRYWDALAEALVGDSPVAAGPRGTSTADVTIPHGRWRQRNEDALESLRAFSRHSNDVQRQLGDAQDRLERSALELQRVRAEHHELHDRVVALSVELAVERAGADVARAERARELEQAVADRAALRWAQGELAALQRTKLMRWTKSARAVYAAARAAREP